MAHNEDVLRVAALAGTTVITPEILRRLDILASQSLNGDEGGIWTPENPIVIGGDGLKFDNAGSIEGGISTSQFARSGAIELADGHWPMFAARTHRIVFPLNDAMFNNWENIYANDGTAPAYNGIRFESSASIRCPLPSHRFPRGAKIKNVTLNYRVGKQPSSAPGTTPALVLIAKTPTRFKGAVVSNFPYWLPSHHYVTGDRVISNSFTPSLTNARMFFCIGGLSTGTSGATEPPEFVTANPGDIFADGGDVLWTCVSLNDVTSLDISGTFAYYSTSAPFTSSPSAYYNSGNPKTISIPNITAFSEVIPAEYYVCIRDSTNTFNTYHSLVIDFELTSLEPGF